MSAPATDLLGDCVPQAVLWLPTDWEMHDFVETHCSGCARFETGGENCSVWAETPRTAWVVGPFGPTCTAFEEAA